MLNKRDTNLNLSIFKLIIENVIEVAVKRETLLSSKEKMRISKLLSVRAIVSIEAKQQAEIRLIDYQKLIYYFQ
jgi:hypothetical protein